MKPCGMIYLFAVMTLLPLTASTHKASADSVEIKHKASTKGISGQDLSTGRATSSPSHGEQGESLAEAVIRLNTEVQEQCRILSPKPLTVPALKAAIEQLTESLAAGDLPNRTDYVNDLTKILATDRIPTSISFLFLPFSNKVSSDQKKENHDGRHVDVSLNYVIIFSNADGSRHTVGLTVLVEVFRIVNAKEQTEPLAPPPPTLSDKNTR